MPWEKQFDIDQALGRAMDAFWARGYEATSMQDLVDCMGINRGSLYATFGDKRSLFIRALQRYAARQDQTRAERLAGPDSPRAAILATFNAAIEAALDAGSRDGCLLVNTALELSPHDPEISDIVGRSFAEMESFFARMIEAGQAGGEVSADVDADDTARALLSLFIGLRVLSRSRPEPVLLNSIAGQAAALLS